MKILFLLLASVLLQDKSKVKPEPVPFTIFAKGTSSGFREKAEKVLTTPKEWTEAWKASQASRPPSRREPQPDVDFNKSVMVLVALGQRRMSGVHVEITRVEKSFGVIQVYIRTTTPGKDAPASLDYTEPFVLVRMAKPDGQVIFTWEKEKD